MLSVSCFIRIASSIRELLKMKLNKIIIGALFNKKSFKLSSLGGIVIDEILGLRESNKN
jgi:hypothetical protein